LKREGAAMLAANRIAQQRAAIKEAIANDEKIQAAELADLIKQTIENDKKLVAEQKALEAEAVRIAIEKDEMLIEAKRIADEAEIQSVQDFNNRLAELSDSSFAQRLGSLTKFNQQNLKLIKANIAAEITLDTNRNLALKTAAIGLAGTLLTIAEQQGGEFFKIAKKFAIANAIISTFQGAAKALELPFPANLVAFATVLAQGFSAVASIKGVSPGGGGGGGAVGGEAAVSTVPIQDTLPTALAEDIPVEEAPDRSLSININVTGFLGSEAELASQLAPVIREAAGTDEVDFGLNTSFTALS